MSKADPSHRTHAQYEVSSFHGCLMVAIADAIAPQILPKYCIEIETRTYRDETESELLVGIPDIVVLESSEFQALPGTEGVESSGVATLTLTSTTPKPGCLIVFRPR
ncbi:MAG: DUF4058 family protein [Tildeniella nuda ZEHNDER 1965/U140]|jgi:hypothetical protein|nr:DUF4058 family protein [Tildeniella nuda ZEHNDER 1965/U140]